MPPTACKKSRQLKPVELFTAPRFTSTHSTFPLLFSLPLFSHSTAHIAFFTPSSRLPKHIWPLCCCLELQVSVCVPARYATDLATEQAQELLPRTGASYRVQLICSNLLLWEAAAPGSTLLLYFSACSFLATSFCSLHKSTRLQIAYRETPNWLVCELVRSYVFSSTVCMALSRHLRQSLQTEGVGIQIKLKSSRYTFQQDTEEVFDASFLPSHSITKWLEHWCVGERCLNLCWEYLEIFTFILTDSSRWTTGNRPCVEKIKWSDFFKMYCLH